MGNVRISSELTENRRQSSEFFGTIFGNLLNSEMCITTRKICWPSYSPTEIFQNSLILSKAPWTKCTLTVHFMYTSLSADVSSTLAKCTLECFTGINGSFCYAIENKSISEFLLPRQTSVPLHRRIHSRHYWTQKPHSHKLTGQLTIFHDWEGVIHWNCQILITLNISLQGSKTSWDHFWTRFIDDHFESLAMVVAATINLSFSVTVVWNVS